MRQLDKPIRRAITSRPPEMCLFCGSKNERTGGQEWNATFTSEGVYVQRPHSRKGKNLFFAPWFAVVDAALRRGLVIDIEQIKAAKARARNV